MRYVCKHPPGNKGHNVAADNFFTFLALVEEMRNKGLHFVGTLRQNRPRLTTEKQMSKDGIGSFDHMADVAIFSHT